MERGLQYVALVRVQTESVVFRRALTPEKHTQSEKDTRPKMTIPNPRLLVVICPSGWSQFTILGGHSVRNTDASLCIGDRKACTTASRELYQFQLDAEGGAGHRPRAELPGPALGPSGLDSRNETPGVLPTDGRRRRMCPAAPILPEGWSVVTKGAESASGRESEAASSGHSRGRGVRRSLGLT